MLPSSIETIRTALPADLEIAGLTADSRGVLPGFLFAALPGAKADGRTFIADAAAKGAVAVLVPEGTQVALPGVKVIVDPNPRRRYALMAAQFHAAQPETVVAVTGTNGKTSTADFVRQIWQGLGRKSASIGTLGVVSQEWTSPGGLTTPDPQILHAQLAKLAKAGVTHACLEASSHGLSQYRLDGVRFRAAAFTNLTRDHLDYHSDMEDYAEAKLRLFSEVVADDGVAVINADSEMAERVAAIAKARGLGILTYGCKGSALKLAGVAPDAGGQRLALEVLGRKIDILLPLAGEFQAANALAALGMVLATGGDQDGALEQLALLKGVPGRLEKVAERANGAAIYVDYAHTPDALATVLQALRPHASGRLAVVFGCGGDRDPGKRPLMGEVARHLADLIVVTDDNPRSEDAGAIRHAILAACPSAIEVNDRARAIRVAMKKLKPGDLLVLAGKGHERGQIVAGTVLPFDDAEEARRAVGEIDGVKRNGGPT